MNRRWTAAAAVPVAMAGLITGVHGIFAGSSAGQPQLASALLCGLTTTSGTPDTSNVSGQSPVDHPVFSVAGSAYSPASPGASCEGKANNGTDFTWSILHSNVNTSREAGTEHGAVTMPLSGAQTAGFQGHVTDFDLSTPISPADPSPCTFTDSNNNQVTWTVFWASGHNYPFCYPDGGSVGNFNTHGGAQDGTHFRGTYGTILYQDSSNNSDCKPNSSTYCFEAVLQGQIN